MGKAKRAFAFLKKNPRYIFLVAAVVTQGLEFAGVAVNTGTIELVLDVVTILIVGRVVKKSEVDKLI